MYLKLKTKLIIAIILIMSFTLWVIYYYISNAQKKDLSIDIYKNALSFATSTSKNIYNNFQRFYESGFITFKSFMSETIKLNDDIKNIQIYNFNGILLYDHNQDKDKQNVYKLYKDNPRIIDNNILKEEIKNINVVVGFDDGGYIDIKNINTDILNKQRVSHIIVPILDENSRHEYSILYEITYKNLDDRINKVIIELSRLFIFVIIFVIIVILIITNSITKNLSKITQKISEISHTADFDTEVDIKSNDETGILAKTFNDMVKKVNVAQKVLINQQKIQREVELAMSIQKSTLPKKIPNVNNIEIPIPFYKPASRVGGDCYDILLDNNNCYIYVADASGHGIGPSVLAAITSSLFYSYINLSIPLKEILLKLHDTIINKTSTNLYITAVFTKLNSDTKTLTYLPAGHTPLIIYKSDQNKTICLEEGGFPIGMKSFTKEVIKKKVEKDSNFIIEKDIKLDKDDCIIYYTDGITEANNKNKDIFTMERFNEAIIKFCSKKELSASQIQEKIIEELMLFIGDAEQSDDITLIVVKIK